MQPDVLSVFLLCALRTIDLVTNKENSILRKFSIFIVPFSLNLLTNEKRFLFG